MSVKAVLVLCAQALLVQTAFSQYLGRGIGCAERIVSPCGLAGAYDGNYGGTYGGAYGGAYDGAYAIANAQGIAPASGGALPISSASPIAPTGISVASENVIEGILGVTGDLPFLSAVAWEGALPTAGAGTVVYSAGNGNIGIVSEGVAAGAAVAEDLAYGSGLATACGFGGVAAPVFNAARGFGGYAASNIGAVRGIGGLAAPAFGGCGCGAVY